MLLRLIAALIVLKQHSFTDAAQDFPNSIMTILHLNLFGLPSFFFISGLLVAQSFEKSSSWKNFLWKRFLRIYPAAWLSILFCAFVLGPIFTTWHLRDYFTDNLLYQFLSTGSLVQVKYFLPGVFENSPMGTSSVNAPLWTVCLELKLYLGLLIFGLLKIRGKRYLLILFVIALLIAGQFFFVQTSAFAKNIIGKEINIYGYFNYAIAFLVGALCNIYKKKIVAKPFWLLIVGLLLALFYFYPLIALALIIVPLFNIFFATRQSVFLKRITPSADLSYGIYVFGFPIQQIIAVYFHPQNTWIFFFLSVLFVLPFAFFSWHVVEKKALRFKYLVR